MRWFIQNEQKKKKKWKKIKARLESTKNFEGIIKKKKEKFDGFYQKFLNENISFNFVKEFYYDWKNYYCTKKNTINVY